MAVTIVGTLEMIYTSGTDTVSEAVPVDMASPTEQPLKLTTGLVFTDPAVDIRDTLEAYLAATYGFTSITRVGSPRAGAMAEWTVVKAGITRAVVLWQSLPLEQVGVELGQTVAGDTGTSGRGYESVEIGADASAGGKHSVAVGRGTTVPEEATDALAFGTDATASGVRSVAMGTRSQSSGADSLSIGTDSQAALTSTAMGVTAKATGNKSTAVGRVALATGASSFAAGDTATALGVNSIAIGVDADASGLDSTAVGQDANATNARATAIGQGATASGANTVAIGRSAETAGSASVAVGSGADASANYSTSLGVNAMASGLHASALGGLSVADSDKSAALGSSAMSLAQEAIAVGYGTRAHGSGSAAIGTYAHIDAGEPGIAEIRGKSLRILRRSEFYFQESEPTTLQLADTTGTLHTIGATPGALTYDGVKIGQVLTYSHNSSPAAESLTGVGTYATAGVLRTDTLQSLIPEITTGLWSVDVVASATVYRSVATGGVWLWIGNGTTAYHQALGRLSPQTHAYTLTMFVSPNNGATNLTPTSVLDLRYTGFSTAGTTTVVSHGWQITARRVG